MADLTGASFKRLSGNADLAASDIYDITQQWSLAVFNNPATVDGIMYMSRHLNTNRAVALYDRASPKIYLRCASTLFAEPGYADIVRMFGIQAI